MAGRRGNNEGNIRVRSDGRWEARYSLPDGSRRSIMGKTRADVAKRLTEALRNLDHGITAPRDERQTFGDYLDHWLTTKKPQVEYGYWARLEQYIRIQIKPNLGKVPLVRLSRLHLKAFYTQMLEEGLSPRTVIHLQETIHNALEAALQDDIVVRNVAHRMKAAKDTPREMQTYTPGQANQLLEAAQGDRLEALYVMMLTTACRWGEVMGLKWDALELERGEMRVISSLKDVRNQRSLGTPKTPRSRRTIPLTALAVECLKRHHVNQTVERLKHGVGWNPHHLVFCTTTGTPYARSNWLREEYKPLIKRAKLPYIRPHDIRHTAATLLLLSGVQPLVVSEMLGHASVAFTLSTYGHVQAAMREPARDAMEQMFGGVFQS